jgi:phosphopantetheinyl transferase
MISLKPPLEFEWLDGHFWEVPHSFGPSVALYRIEVPPHAIVPSDAIGTLDHVRAARIRDRIEANRFLASHAVLRSVLAKLLGETSRQLEIIAGADGKPRLAGNPVRFNMSRCGPMVLVGLSEAREIGVDIEQYRALPDLTSLARTHLSHREYEAWRTRKALLQEDTFLDYWTRKEACLKAAGIGLSMPLERVDVGVGAHHSPDLVTFRSGLREWTVEVASLAVPTEMSAAVALTD